MSYVIHHKNFPYTELAMFWKDFLQFLSWIEKHRIQASHLIALTLTFVLSSNQHGATQSVHWVRYTLEDMEFKSWQVHDIYPFSKISKPAAAPIQPPTQWKPQLFSGSKITTTDRLTTHICLARSSKNQCRYTSTQPVSLHGTILRHYCTITSYLCTALTSGDILSVL